MVDERCSRCDGPMEEDAGFAIVCGPDGAGGMIDLPVVRRCADEDCRRAVQAERDEAAIARAVASGVITP